MSTVIARRTCELGSVECRSDELGFVRFACPVFLYQRPSAARTNMPTSAANAIQADCSVRAAK